MKTSDRIHIPVSRPALIGREKEYVLECLDSVWISSNGKYIELFEKKFAEYLGTKHAITCSNGTVALHLALLALGIGAGDEVIVPSLTYVATANAVKYTGATPVFAESEPDTWNMDPGKIEPIITPRTKAIVAVPLYGHPCDMDPIIKITRANRLYLIEDAAEAVGAKYRGRLCGSIADISTFSFYGNKTITTGEGGMVVTNDNYVAEKVKLFKGQGMDIRKRYWFVEVGYNYRMTNIQAAIGLAQLENVEKLVAKRRQIADWYNSSLKDNNKITLPAEKDYATHSYWMYSILIEDTFGKSRDEVMDYLTTKGVETRPFFYPMHVMPVYKQDNAPQLTLAEDIARKGTSLPTFFELTKEDIIYISSLLS